MKKKESAKKASNQYADDWFDDMMKSGVETKKARPEKKSASKSSKDKSRKKPDMQEVFYEAPSDEYIEPAEEYAEANEEFIEQEPIYVEPTPDYVEPIEDYAEPEEPAEELIETEPIKVTGKKKDKTSTDKSAFEYKDKGFFGYISRFVFAVFSLLIISISIFAIHPGSSITAATTKATVLRMGDNLDVFMNNAASDVLSDIAYIRKIFVIPESSTVAPTPNPDGFGTTTDPARIMEVIAGASDLLEGQEMIFNPNLDFVPGSKMRWYYDETILLVTWQEYIDSRCCTCAEVKIAHGSQLRRKLADDSYGSSVQLYASDMAAASNAVVAVNGDFYAFRELGITVYQRNLYRNAPETVDTCFFTSSGDMIFSRAGELTKKGEAERFIKENDVVFSAAFGPILVDNGEVQKCNTYPIGEIDTEYSRSCIALKDNLHYFMMTINHTPDARPRATINQLATYIHSKGVQKAYTLDGGQTSEIVMMGGPINNVDFGNERTVSDIIYFATALPEEG